MPKHFNLSDEPMTHVGDFSVEGQVTLRIAPEVLEGFNSIMTVRFGDLPPSVLAALWHDTEQEPAFHDLVAQVFFDMTGYDIAEYYTKMLDRLGGKS